MDLVCNAGGCGADSDKDMSSHAKMVPQLNEAENICQVNSTNIEAPANDTSIDITAPRSGDGPSTECVVVVPLLCNQSEIPIKRKAGRPLGSKNRLRGGGRSSCGFRTEIHEAGCVEGSESTLRVKRSSSRGGSTSTLRRKRKVSSPAENQIVDVTNAAVPSVNKELQVGQSMKLIWQAAEAMKTFKKLPQKPHFHAVKSCRPYQWEGAAVGLMVNYETLMQKAANLKCYATCEHINEDLEILLELERNGFAVDDIRDRLTLALLLRTRQEEQMKLSEYKKQQLAEFRCERAAIQGKIVGLQKFDELLALSMEKVDAETKQIGEELALTSSKIEELMASPFVET